ncbi:DMT family transporter [Bacillus sp. JJ722]|uniref:DMT family transporter n=1 Tax=Bacillus sp. JJ722 TaxID=3122973 RepID=UPI003000DAB6
MIGIVFAILAGILISFQSIFNAKVNEHVGHWLTTSLVLGLGCATSYIMYVVTERSLIFSLQTTNDVYYISGIFGIGIVICLMKSVTLMGPSYTILISLITQLSVAFCIDTFGLFGLEVIPFQLNKLLGIVILIIGVMIFKGILPSKNRLVKQHS